MDQLETFITRRDLSDSRYLCPLCHFQLGVVWRDRSMFRQHLLDLHPEPLAVMLHSMAAGERHLSAFDQLLTGIGLRLWGLYCPICRSYVTTDHAVHRHPELRASQFEDEPAYSRRFDENISLWIFECFYCGRDCYVEREFLRHLYHGHARLVVGLWHRLGN